jgi:hypothetical protein
LTLITTSVIGGTFAKYVTTGGASETARVAKFGVEVTASGNLFAKTYLKTTNTPGTDGAEASTLSVVSASTSDGGDDKNVVAPGTKNDAGLTFTITGQPEVDVKIDVAIGDKWADILLPTGKYKDVTHYYSDIEGGYKEYDVTNYYPIQYTLTQTKKNDTAAKPLVTKGTLEDVKTALNNIKSEDVAANTDLSTVYGTYNLTWEWPYETEKTIEVDGEKVKSNYNVEDTILGDIIANKPADIKPEGVTPVTETNVDFTITVTQVD